MVAMHAYDQLIGLYEIISSFFLGAALLYGNIDITLWAFHQAGFLKIDLYILSGDLFVVDSRQ
jgi:hypothetical protein